MLQQQQMENVLNKIVLTKKSRGGNIIKLTCLVALFFLCAFFAVYVASLHIQKTLKKVQILNEKKISRLTESIGSEVQNAIEIVHTLSISQVYIDMNNSRLEHVSQYVQKTRPIFDLVFVCDATGMQTARSSGKNEDRSYREYFINAIAGKRYVTPVYLSSTGKPSITIAYPIYNKSKIVGVVAGNITLDRIVKKIKDVKIGKNGYIDVYDENFRLIFSQDHETINYIKNQDSQIKTKIKIDKDKKLYIERAQNGFVGSFNGKNIKNEDSIISVSLVPGLHWCILSYYPLHETIQDSTPLIWFITIFAFAFFIFFVLFLFPLKIKFELNFKDKKNEPKNI